MNTDVRKHETKPERRSGGFNFYKFDTTAEIIYEPELCRQKDMTAYYEGFQEIVVKKGGLIISVLIADLPENEKTEVKNLMKAIADLSTGI